MKPTCSVEDIFKAKPLANQDGLYVIRNFCLTLLSIMHVLPIRWGLDDRRYAPGTGRPLRQQKATMMDYTDTRKVKPMNIESGHACSGGKEPCSKRSDPEMSEK